MPKKSFRSTVGTQKVETEYPTREDFAHGRRNFLKRVGSALLGAGAIATIAACGDRAFTMEPDGGSLPPDPDMMTHGGVPLLPDSDVNQPDPDMETLGGIAPSPDSGADHTIFEPDTIATPGYAPAPDSGLPMAGGPLQPDAQVDKKSDGGI